MDAIQGLHNKQLDAFAGILEVNLEQTEDSSDLAFRELREVVTVVCENVEEQFGLCVVGGLQDELPVLGKKEELPRLPSATVRRLFLRQFLDFFGIVHQVEAFVEPVSLEVLIEYPREYLRRIDGK